KNPCLADSVNLRILARSRPSTKLVGSSFQKTKRLRERTGTHHPRSFRNPFRKEKSAMTQQQFENRKERAENEPLVIARTDEGFRVYSPSNRTRSYIVSGSVQAPSCTCPNFQYHDGDASWRCKHI